MTSPVKDEQSSPARLDTTTTSTSSSRATSTHTSSAPPDARPRQQKSKTDTTDASKRRCVSTACIACRRRKSKCDGNLPACAACASVYSTECVYDPNSDHRRKGVYKKDADTLKTKNSTLQTLIQAILNYQEEDVPALIRRIRTCESLDMVAEAIAARERGEDVEEEEDTIDLENRQSNSPTFETQLSSKMGTLKLGDGRLHFVGGTSNLLYGEIKSLELPQQDGDDSSMEDFGPKSGNPALSWTTVTSDPDLVTHLLNHYFTWHYTFFTILPKASFYKQFLQGHPRASVRRKAEYCSPLLVNTLLSLGCHFTSNPGAREDAADAATAGDHFFKEAKRLLYEGDELAKPSLATVQALALMSVREAGCAREANGWVYSGMAFRMSCDLGLSFQTPAGLVLNRTESFDEEEDDARRVTFWGCFLIDKCWSNYLGRMPQFQLSDNVTVPRYEVFPSEEADPWSPYSDSGFSQAHTQPGRVRAVALQILTLCEISSDLIKHFYNPQSLDKPIGKQTELKRLSEIHMRLEDWRRNLPKELEPKEGTLSSALIMHMFFQLLYIHLFRPFLKYTQATSPLPGHVSPRKLCTQAAGMISKLLRLYKRSHGLRQIVNFAIYVVHSACTIHLLNLPDKIAKRDIIHGVKHLEEMAEGWLVARRTLSVLSMQARKWKVDLPEEAAAVLAKTDAKFGAVGSPYVVPSPQLTVPLPNMKSTSQSQIPSQTQQHMNWQQMDSAFPVSMQMYGIGNVMNVDGMQAMSTTVLPSASASQLPSQTQTPYSISPISQDFSPQPSMATPTHAVKRTNTGQSIPQQQQQQAQAMRGQMQPPQFPPQQQTQQTQHSQQQQQRFIAPLRRSSSIRSAQQSSGSRPSAASFSGDMFGGVEALLREGQEWWMKDQSHDLASGFGNWKGSAGSLDMGSSAWMNQQQQQPMTMPPTTPQRQYHQQSSQHQQQGQVQYDTQQLQQQHQPHQRYMSRSGSIPENTTMTSTPPLRGGSGGGSTVATNMNGMYSGASGQYEFGNLPYNEDEWYQ